MPTKIRAMPARLSHGGLCVSAVAGEGFGVGGVPCYTDQDFSRAVGHWVDTGKPLIMTTQVTYEGSDMSVYEVGHSIKTEFGVLENYDMPLEAVVTKTMWILGQTTDPMKIREMFYTPVQKDILCV